MRVVFIFVRGGFQVSEYSTIILQNILTISQLSGYSCECEDCPAACNTDFNDNLVHKRGVCLINSEGVVNGTESFIVESPELLSQVCPGKELSRVLNFSVKFVRVRNCRAV